MNFFWLIVDNVYRLHNTKGRGNQNEHIQRSTRFRKVSVQFMSVFCLEPLQSVLSSWGQTFHGSDIELLVRVLRQKFQDKKLVRCSPQQRTSRRREKSNKVSIDWHIISDYIPISFIKVKIDHLVLEMTLMMMWSVFRCVRLDDEQSWWGAMAVPGVWLSVQVNQCPLSHWVQACPVWGTHLHSLRRVSQN